MVGSEVPGSRKRRMGTIILEVLAAENTEVESTNRAVIQRNVGSHSLRLVGVITLIEELSSMIWLGSLQPALARSIPNPPHDILVTTNDRLRSMELFARAA